jgi:hypothetical protein
MVVAGATAGSELGTILRGAEFEVLLEGVGVCDRACAFAEACASVAALAGVLLLSSSSGGKFGKVLSGT